MTPIESWKHLHDLELRIRAQDMAVQHFSGLLRIAKDGVGKEVRVHSDLPESIRRNSYYTNRMLYHLRRVLEVSTELAPRTVKPGKVFSFTAGALPFELDALLSAASTIVIEQPYRGRVEKYLPAHLKRRFLAAFPKRGEPTSLYWRLHLLRNRAVHVDQEIYSANYGVFGEFSSSFVLILVDGEISEIPTTLIDLNDHHDKPEVIAAIRAVIEDPEKNLMDELFGKGRPRGTPRKHQPVVHFGSGFDLVRGLPHLCDEILAVVDRLHHVYAEWFATQIPIDGSARFHIDGSNGGSITVSEMFPELEIK